MSSAAMTLLTAAEPQCSRTHHPRRRTLHRHLRHLRPLRRRPPPVRMQRHMTEHTRTSRGRTRAIPARLCPFWMDVVDRTGSVGEHAASRVAQFPAPPTRPGSPRSPLRRLPRTSVPQLLIPHPPPPLRPPPTHPPRSQRHPRPQPRRRRRRKVPCFLGARPPRCRLRPRTSHLRRPKKARPRTCRIEATHSSSLHCGTTSWTAARPTRWTKRPPTSRAPALRR